MDFTPRTHQDSTVIAASPEEVYAVVSDVTRTGEWSPTCRECWWEDGDGPKAGAHFVGRNEARGRTWETRSEVTAAEVGKEFAWAVGDDYVRWGFAMRAVDGGTELTESWEHTPVGQQYFVEMFGDSADKVAEMRQQAAHDDIPATLAAIKRIVEAE